MCRILPLVSMLLIAILSTLSTAHQPDPAQIDANVLLRGSHGHFITRTADLFIDDNTHFDQPVAITQRPFVLRALSPYDMHLDPGWDQSGWDIEARRQKLTAPGTTRLLVDSGPDLLIPSTDGDLVLHIDPAAFYDDNEADETGGFWANWRIIVTPVQFGPSGPVQADARFLSLLRGPFWSGEKLEVADTKDGYRPQIMHYTHLGIWNWSWPIPGFGPVDAVEVRLEEGDDLLPNDHIVTYVVQRDETSDASITLSDMGDVVALSITVRATAVEWPAHRAVATDFLRWDTAAAESGAAHLIFDMPIPIPGQPYVVIHEILTYQPSGDDDLSWSLYFERLDDHVNVQLASGNAGNDSGVFVEAEARVLQFPTPSR